MAPYNPPVSHYTELDVSEYDENFMFAFIGKGGKRHYWLTRMLGIDYLWYNDTRRVLEIWGPYNVLETRQAQELLKSELEIFQPKSVDATLAQTNEHVQEASNQTQRDIEVVS